MSTINIKRVKTSEIELKDRLVSIQRVAKVTKGGRTFSFSAIVVVGDENGVVGYGLGKAKEVTEAIAKGIDDAKKNLVKVPIINGTIPHEQIGKFSGGFIFLKPAANGTGVIAGVASTSTLWLILRKPKASIVFFWRSVLSITLLICVILILAMTDYPLNTLPKLIPRCCATVFASRNWANADTVAFTTLCGFDEPFDFANTL